MEGECELDIELDLEYVSLVEMDNSPDEYIKYNVMFSCFSLINVITIIMGLNLCKKKQAGADLAF